jgi:hypothetical protein
VPRISPSGLRVGAISLNINRESHLYADDLVDSLLQLCSVKSRDVFLCLQDCSSWPQSLRLRDSCFVVFSGCQECRVRTVLHHSRSRLIVSVKSSMYSLSILFSDQLAVHNMYLPDTGHDNRTNASGDAEFFSAMRAVRASASEFRVRGAKHQLFCGDCNIHLLYDGVVAGPASSTRVDCSPQHIERMNALRELAVAFSVRSDLTWSDNDPSNVNTRWPWVWERPHTQIDHVLVPACAQSNTFVVNHAPFRATDHFPVVSSMCLPCKKSASVSSSPPSSSLRGPANTSQSNSIKKTVLL